MIKYNLPAISGILLFACTHQSKNISANTDDLYHRLQQLSDSITVAEVNDDLQGFLTHYDVNAISMPEYQPTLTGISQVQSYYKEIFHRQNIKTFKRTRDEFIDLDSTIIEIGAFHKEFTMISHDSVITQDGKYFFVYKKSPEGKFKITAETFGFFHPVDKPETLIVRELMPEKPETYHDEEIPFELRAYNALMEKYVARSGSGALRSEFFTDDGKFFPFEHPTVSGINEINPIL
jgi:ketosteroid isomerase-like protein